MKVTLLHNTPLEIAVKAIRTCYDSMDKSDTINGVLGEKDKKLIKQIIQAEHTSTLEHISYNLHMEGFTRLCLQELSRHRVSSPSVKSTRYTLKEVKKEESFIVDYIRNTPVFDKTRASKYLRLLDIPEIDNVSISALENIRILLVEGKHKIDKIKYCLPESYLVNEMYTINVRSLRNFLKLRLSNAAHFEIRELSQKIVEALPKDHLIMFEDIIGELNG